MRKMSDKDRPPPGAGVKTETEAVPAEAMSAAVMVALNSVALTNAVARAAPFHSTTETGRKADPVTVKANPCPPARTVEGESEVSTGAGFSPGSGPTALPEPISVIATEGR